jgi:hypothetical protein
MIASPSPRLLQAMTRAYRLLLCAYPDDFRRTYGPDMARLFEDRAREVLASPGRSRLAPFALHVASDWIQTVTRERIAALWDGVTMTPALACLCVFSLAAGCWLALMESILRHPAFLQRIALAAVIVGQSALTLGVISGSSGRLSRLVISAGACMLLAMGALAVSKNVTGHHFEGFALIIGLALVVQAILTVSMVVRGARTASLTQ